jgi:hypothetical protein
LVRGTKPGHLMLALSPCSNRTSALQSHPPIRVELLDGLSQRPAVARTFRAFATPPLGSVRDCDLIVMRDFDRRGVRLKIANVVGSVHTSLEPGPRAATPGLPRSVPLPQRSDWHSEREPSHRPTAETLGDPRSGASVAAKCGHTFPSFIMSGRSQAPRSKL